jgi:hypothetical protein
MSKNNLNFHELALNGKLNTIDPKLLTLENLLKRDNNGNTPIRKAAYTGNLYQIPYPILIKIDKKEMGAIPHITYLTGIQKSKEIYRNKLTKEIPQVLKSKTHAK